MTDDRRLDAALESWARHDTGDQAAVARILRHADMLTQSGASPIGRRRWLPFAAGGAGIAASFVVAMMLISSMPGPTGSEDQQGQTELAALDTDVESFAMLHTLTEEEEQYL